MSVEQSILYDFGPCDVDFVTESDFYREVTIRFNQNDGADDAQVTLTAMDAASLASSIMAELKSDPAYLIKAQLSGQKMAHADSAP